MSENWNCVVTVAHTSPLLRTTEFNEYRFKVVFYKLLYLNINLRFVFYEVLYLYTHSYFTKF